MTKILAADIGGTKTLLQLSDCSNGRYQLLYEQRFSSHAYDSFDQLLTAFRTAARFNAIDHACFAIAGPVTSNGNSANLTNLPWSLDRDHLRKTYNITNVTLINDFHAVAIGIETLTNDEILTLQSGQPQRKGPQLIIGAGTGLGVAVRIWNGSHYSILASEAGHAGYSPANNQQRLLLDFLAVQHPMISREHLLSGQGLVNIYRFMCQQQQIKAEEIRAEEISQLAQQGSSLCIDTLALFFTIYGSEAGNLALTTLPLGGVYIAGGIAAKNMSALEQSDFTRAFCDKNNMRSLLASIPIHVIKNESVGLQGARWLASHQDQE